jgi:hypothetical protein
VGDTNAAVLPLLVGVSAVVLFCEIARETLDPVALKVDWAVSA